MNLRNFSKYGFAGLFLWFNLFSSQTFAGVKDSVGVENKAGKMVILHKVAPKETLFAIARRYKAAVADIQKENPEVAKGISADQIIKIPTQRNFTAKANTKTNSTPTPPEKSKGKKHVVSQGQTLFAVARQYNVSVDDIRKWNNLTSNELSAGQELVISAGSETTAKIEVPVRKTEEPAKSNGGGKTHTVEQGQTLFAVARQYNVSVDDLKKWNNLPASGEVSVGQVLQIGAAQKTTEIAEKPVKPEPKQENSITPTESKPIQVLPSNAKTNTVNAGGYDRIVESGLAEVIEQGSESKKHLCLHRTAPIGSILQVKNEMNGSMVFVRVIGKLPDTGANDKLLLRISKKPYERLSPSGKRFQVEVSYPAP